MSISVDIELLGKYLSGEASPEEAMAISDWMADNTENRRLFGEIASIWERTDPGTGHQLPDKQQVMAELQDILAKTHIQKHPVRKIFTYKSAVALLLLLVGSTIGYFFLRHKEVPVSLNEVVKQTAAGIFRDTLPDHSVVVLNSYSQLKYTQGFGKHDRHLLLSGQAWFDVAPDPQQAFVIHVGDIQIKVLGTAFNVIQDSSKIEATVKSGAILMYKGTENITVKAGQKGEYRVLSQHFTISDTVDIQSMSYATRVFNFENTTLKEVAATLGKAYGIDIVIENKKLENCTMSSSFDNKPLQYILDVISITLNVECRKDRNTVYISGVSCS